MKNTTLRRIWSYVGKYKLPLFWVFLCGVTGNLLLIFGPSLMGRAITHIRGEKDVDFKGLLILVIILAFLYFISSLFQWLMAVVSNHVANKTIHDLRRDAFEHLSRLPLKYFDNTPHGDIISRLTNDIDAISDGLFQGITQIMSAAVIIIGCFLFMLFISPVITLAVLIITPLCFCIASFIARRSVKMFAGQQETVGELNGFVEEHIGNQKIVKAFGHEKQSAEEFEEINKRLYYWGQKAQWYSSLTNPTTRFVNNTAYVAVSVLGGLMAIQGKILVGDVFSLLTYSSQFAKPINEITSITTQIQAAFASARRVFALLDEEPEEEIYPERIQLEHPEGNVSFENVKFSYRPDVPLIRNLNLHVKKGSMTAIVGPTGSGKTTLVNLLMRFYSVDGGNILVDGNNIYKITKESLRRSIGMVLQESWLFSGTVAENISYSRPDALREEVIEAAKAAKAHSFIKKLPNGYDTLIDEEGGNLSQGQKQLLTIARVMLMDPPMLILDEATSSIDTRTELNIQKAFVKMMRGRTSFVIAHRLSTIREADTILVLKDGDIIEQGNHEDLLTKKGFYYKLYNSQFTSDVSNG